MLQREREQIEIDSTRLLDHVLSQVIAALLIGGIVGLAGAFAGAIYLLYKLMGWI